MNYAAKGELISDLRNLNENWKNFGKSELELSFIFSSTAMSQQLVSSNITSVEAQLAETERNERERRENLRELQKQVQAQYQALEEARIKKKALQAYQTATPSGPSPPPPPSQQIRKKFAPIPPEIKGLIAKKVFYEKSMTWDKAINTYGVSRGAISRILNEERKRTFDSTEETAFKPPQKRGRKSPLDRGDILVYILDLKI